MSGQSRDKLRWERARMIAVIAVLMGGLVAAVVRVHHLQTVEADELEEMSRAQTSGSVEIKAKRGSIVDRSGVELAGSVEVPSIFAHPRQIDDPKAVARRLLPHLDLDFDELVAKLERDKGFVWLEHQTTPEVADAIARLELPGIGSTPESKRYYPLRERAGQLLGFVGIDGRGLEGLEQALDEELSGDTFEMKGVRDARGRTLVKREIPRFRELEGNSVELTLDERIQRVSEEALADQVDEFDARGGYAMAVDVENGDVLAMANTPDFDPNRFGDFDSDDWRLRNVTDTFEPGSTTKPFVFARALDKGAVSLDTTFDTEEGWMQVGGHTIRDTESNDSLTAAEIIQKSSNIGIYKIAKLIGKEALYETLRDFGFGTRTGLGLRGERAGVIWPHDDWAEVTFANISFGQGFTSTPLQLIQSIAAIANDGMLMEPRLVRRVVDRDGELVEERRPELVRQVVSAEAARKTTKAMSLVTQEEGTGTKAALEHHTVAGKSGTAQKVNPETRQYDPDLWMSSFVGFAPAEDPEIAVLVMIDEPQDEVYGGKVAGPAFRRIMKEALSVREVAPLPADERLFAEPEDETAIDALGDVEDGPVELPARRVEGERAADGEEAVPDLRGMTLRAALNEVRSRGLLPRTEGWGRVVSQEPEPGTSLEEADVLRLELSPRGTETTLADEPAEGAR
ncbi:MAG: penicillin-binding protein [Persicimonas sp.]